MREYLRVRYTIYCSNGAILCNRLLYLILYIAVLVPWNHSQNSICSAVNKQFILYIPLISKQTSRLSMKFMCKRSWAIYLCFVYRDMHIQLYKYRPGRHITKSILFGYVHTIDADSIICEHPKKINFYRRRILW